MAKILATPLPGSAAAADDAPAPAPRVTLPESFGTVVTPLPPTARFEPLNLEPFIKEVDSPAEELPEPAQTRSTHRPPARPEALAVFADKEEEEDTFAPGADFDSLPPPLEPVPDALPVAPPPPAAERSTRTWIALGSVIAVIAAGGYAWKLTHQSDATAVEQPVVGSGAPPRNPTAPQTPANTKAAANVATAAAKAPVAATSQSEIITTQPAWVRLLADGERVIERELPANSRIPFRAEKTIQIRTGNAGAVRLSIRGIDQGTLGREGEVVTRSFAVPAR